ncbi:MAG TPA: copper chaperone PCu(A)C [Xanthomonadaceae bacterium]|jgi:copper(I)-binding protein|nr:copper chaperone PCu(A)C [Xanthomonadaceae bacterium]
MKIEPKATIVVVLLLAAAMRPVLAANPAPMTMPMPKPAAVSTVAAHAHVDAAWVRAAPPGATMLAGYMVVHNDGKTPLRLVSATSDEFGMVELHRSLIVNGMSTMRPAGEQAILAGGTLKIAPGGLHWMLMQPKRALKVGDRVHFRLDFADGGSTDVGATVAASEPR